MPSERAPGVYGSGSDEEEGRGLGLAKIVPKWKKGWNDGRGQMDRGQLRAGSRRPENQELGVKLTYSGRFEHFP